MIYCFNKAFAISPYCEKNVFSFDSSNFKWTEKLPHKHLVSFFFILFFNQLVAVQILNEVFDVVVYRSTSAGVDKRPYVVLIIVSLMIGSYFTGTFSSWITPWIKICILFIIWLILMSTNFDRLNSTYWSSQQKATKEVTEFMSI